MVLKFTEAIEEVADEGGDSFMAWLKDHAPELIDTVAAEKNLSLGDVHVSAAGGDDKKKKPKKQPPGVGEQISVVDDAEKGEPVDKTFALAVCKIDKEKQIFYGWAYVSEENGKVLVDKQDDFIEPADLLAAAEDFTLQGGKLGDMHDQRNVGRVVASFVTTKELCDTFGIKCASDRRGWILGFKVDDPDVWAKIKGGAQLELSIGGKGERIPTATDLKLI